MTQILEFDEGPQGERFIIFQDRLLQKAKCCKCILNVSSVLTEKKKWAVFPGNVNTLINFGYVFF